jgi:nucleotide-binding universal stress UspA family protein
MTSIKNILVPTDFSATARAAFNYAKVLANALDATITVVHVNEFFLAASELAVAPSPEREDDRIREALDDFINDETTEETVMVKAKVKTKLLRGEVISRLVELSQSGEVDMIVMGTTGLQDVLSKIIGSTSLDVANKSFCPVVLVPRDAKWTPINRILFAGNETATTPQIVRRITDFAALFSAAVHFVYVDNNKLTEEKVAENIWDELFEVGNPQTAFEIHTLYSKDTVGQLRRYAQEHDINLVAFVSKHRTFWQNLIHHSISQNMAISTEIPMMVMHFDDAA